MAEVHQFYVTHCTYGSSALERREGDLAHRMLGYSARAGSLETAELRRRYRQIERYLYYYLPRDTPPEDKLSLTASSAPRRLIYLPPDGGLQWLAQVCYRATDTQGRPGSYFAHVLCQDCRDGSRPWSPLECLRLWNAPGWVQEDRDEIPFLLPPLTAPDDLLYGRRPAIDDRLLRSFLIAESESAMDDPQRVIPARWRSLDAAQRRQALEQVLQGVLQQDLRQQAGLLLVVEAEMAALLFYGAVRLLPPGPWREGLSFSTFEPNPDRLCTRLAAIEFHDPLASDLRPDSYRAAGTMVVNTFLRHGAGSPAVGAYTTWILQRLADEGWESVDLALDRLTRCQARTMEDLDRVAVADRAVPVLLAGSRPTGDAWCRGVAAEYLGQAVRDHLARLADDPAALERLLGTAAHVPLIELAGTQCDLQCRLAVAYLLNNVPDVWIGELTRSGQVAREDKLALLARYLIARGELPPGCDCVREGYSSGDPFLAELLARLDAHNLERFYASGGAGTADVFLSALMAACRLNPALRPSLGHVIRALDEDQLVDLLLNHGEILRHYPADVPALPERLEEILTKLPLPLARFSRRLDAVLAGSPLLHGDHLRRLARHWYDCRAALLDLRRLERQISPLTRQRPWRQIEDALRIATTALKQALPAEAIQDDRPGTFRLRCLRQLTVVLLGTESLPGGPWRHDALWRKVQCFLAQDYWPAEPLGRFRPAVWRWGPLAVAAAVVLLALAALVVWQASSGNFRIGPHETGESSAAGGTGSEQTPGDAPGAARQDSLPGALPQGDLSVRFTIDALRTSFTAAPRSKAMVSVIVQDARGREIGLASSAGAVEGLAVRARVWESRAEGPTTTELLAADTKLSAIEVGDHVQLLWLSLEFLSAPAGSPEERPSLLATSVPVQLKPETGIWYQITFQLSDEQLNGLRARPPLSGPREF